MNLEETNGVTEKGSETSKGRVVPLNYGKDHSTRNQVDQDLKWVHRRPEQRGTSKMVSNGKGHTLRPSRDEVP